jgi:ComF family protein
MATAWQDALSRWTQALLPCSCVLCGLAAPSMLCAPCRAQCLDDAPLRCPVCADPLPAGVGEPERCGRCTRQPPAFDATVAAASYELPMDRLVLQLKFGAALAHARLFGELLAQAVQAQPALPLPALLCPVPLGPDRLSERGFNQALEIAKPLGRRLGIALAPRLVCRVQDTMAQSLLHGSARRSNIAHAFSVPDRALVEGRHIGVVDDVMSSGQTLNELAATLKRHGAARVTNLVFARTPPQQ